MNHNTMFLIWVVFPICFIILAIANLIFHLCSKNDTLKRQWHPYITMFWGVLSIVLFLTSLISGKEMQVLYSTLNGPHVNLMSLNSAQFDTMTRAHTFEDMATVFFGFSFLALAIFLNTKAIRFCDCGSTLYPLYKKMEHCPKCEKGLLAEKKSDR